MELSQGLVAQNPHCRFLLSSFLLLLKVTNIVGSFTSSVGLPLIPSCFYHHNQVFTLLFQPDVLDITFLKLIVLIIGADMTKVPDCSCLNKYSFFQFWGLGSTNSSAWHDCVEWEPWSWFGNSHPLPVSSLAREKQPLAPVSFKGTNLTKRDEGLTLIT